ncbi:NADP-dependent malic enzyme [Xylaria sp. FL0933]|nr:NADP-dependent malic enzyme [Xylaria sp. FL0933]
MAKLHGLTSRTSKTRVFGPPPRTATGSLLLRSPPAPGFAVHKTGRCRTNLTLAPSYYPSSGHIAHYHRYSSSQHLSEPCPSHSGPFSSTTPVRKWNSHSSAHASHAPPAATDHISAARPGPSTYSSTLSPRPAAGLLYLPGRPRQPMAYNTYSTASSDISTPRSSSPSSVFSGRSSHTSASVASKRLSLSLQRRQSAFNPMSSVDIASIEQRMKMASLDGLRGYAQDHYGEVKQNKSTEYVPQSAAGGYQVLREPLWNKGLSFTPEERIAKNLTGLIPHAMENADTQVERCMKMINSRSTPIDKYLYLSSLKSQNLDLFYRVLIDNVRDLMPLVYTPTIGDVCLQYSTLYTRPEALYISIKQRKSIRTILRNWPHPNPEICVVTDGSRILGLGDLGVNGVGISIGKLALYTGAAGIHPEKTLPIVLDAGTANEDNLKDPLYLGLRAKRPPPDVMQGFVDEFMEAVRDVFPEMLVQFEDFETEKAFNYLSRYRNDYKCFNDDIQGTGAVVLAGYIGAVNLSGVPLDDQRLVFMGAGSAGVGVAKQMVEYYTRRGLSEAAAKDKFWLVDTKGLVTWDRGDKLPEHKKYFARSDNNGHQFRTLEEVIEYVRPSALVGLTATFGVFTESVVRALKASVDSGGSGRRPILFPLSNPLTKAECTFEQAVQWTEGTVIFASGSPFSPFAVKSGDSAVTYWPNQGNNVYVFPGLGLGAILAKASKITDEMVYMSAASLAESLNAEEIHKGLIYPRIERVRDASLVVAREVMKAARREGVSMLPEEQWVEWEEWGDVALTKYIKDRVYDPLK